MSRRPFAGGRFGKGAGLARDREGTTGHPEGRVWVWE